MWALLVSFALYTLILQNGSLDPGLTPSHCPALRGTHCRSRETKPGIIISKVMWSTDHSTVAYPVFFSLSDTSEGRLHHILKAQGSFCLSDLPSLECSLLPMVVVRSPSLCIPGKRRKREARRKGRTSFRKTKGFLKAPEVFCFSPARTSERATSGSKRI